MKKSVGVLVILTLLLVTCAAASTRIYSRQIGHTGWMTGAQILDLPPPPTPPGGETTTPATTPAPAPTPVPQTIPTPVAPAPPEPTTKAVELLEQAQSDLTTLGGRIESLEKRTEAINLIPGFEERLNKVEVQASAASTVVARIDSLQSQVEAMKVDNDNFKQVASRPTVEEPTFVSSIADLKSALTRNLILALSVSIVALLLVISVIGYAIVSNNQSFDENKRLIKQYLTNYQGSGYPLDTLRMHLRACGWKDDFVDKVVDELPK